MTAPSPLAPHRAWIVALLCAVALALAATGIGSLARATLTQEAARLRQEQAALTKQLAQWEADAKTARDCRSELEGEDSAALLAPGDRTALAERLEPLAAAHRLSGFLYTLGPEELWPGEPAFPGLSGIAQSRLTVEAEAALDTDALSFLHALEKTQGRLDLQNLSLRRAREKGPATIHLQAAFLWLAGAQPATPPQERTAP